MIDPDEFDATLRQRLSADTFVPFFRRVGPTVSGS